MSDYVLLPFKPDGDKGKIAVEFPDEFREWFLLAADELDYAGEQIDTQEGAKLAQERGVPLPEIPASVESADYKVVFPSTQAMSVLLLDEHGYDFQGAMTFGILRELIATCSSSWDGLERLISRGLTPSEGKLFIEIVDGGLCLTAEELMGCSDETFDAFFDTSDFLMNEKYHPLMNELLSWDDITLDDIMNWQYNFEEIYNDWVDGHDIHDWFV